MHIILSVLRLIITIFVIKIFYFILFIYNLLILEVEFRDIFLIIIEMVIAAVHIA